MYVKAIDNQHVKRPADPADKRAWRRMVGYGSLAVLVLVMALGPRAWLRHSSYRQAELTEKRTELLESRVTCGCDTRRSATCAG